jgi:hypothetical protein
MTRHRTDLDTASANPITALATTCNRVTRICALSLGQSEKAASETLLSLPSCPRLPVKAKSPKRLVASQVTDASGFHPTLAKPSRMAMRVNRLLSATTIRTRPRQSVGATNDPRYGCLIYEAESADRLIRLHRPSMVALTGERLYLGE